MKVPEFIEASASNLTYNIPGDLAAALGFHAGELKQAGWNEITNGQHTDDVRVVRYFEKQDFAVMLLIVKSIDKTGHIDITMTNIGNIDPRKLPYPEGAKQIHAARAICQYELKTAEIKEARGMSAKAGEELARVGRIISNLLAYLGWIRYKDLPKRPPSANYLTLHFMNRGMNLDVSLYRTESKADVVAFSYGCRQLEGELPIVASASKVLFDGGKYLNYVTDAKVTDVAALYRQELSAMGWKLRPDVNTVHGGQAQLYFDGNDEKYLDVNAIAQSKGGTNVLVKQVSLAELTASLKEAEERRAGTLSPETTASTEEIPDEFDEMEALADALSSQLEDTAAKLLEQADEQFSSIDEASDVGNSDSKRVGIPAASFPVPKLATKVDRTGDLDNIMFNATMTSEEMVKFFRLALPPLGWKEKKDDTIVDDDYTSVIFQKENAMITISAVGQSEPGTFRVFVKGTGLILPTRDEDGLESFD
jgi:hypothetical protein